MQNDTCRGWTAIWKHSARRPMRALSETNLRSTHEGPPALKDAEVTQLRRRRSEESRGTSAGGDASGTDINMVMANRLSKTHDQDGAGDGVSEERSDEESPFKWLRFQDD